MSLAPSIPVLKDAPFYCFLFDKCPTFTSPFENGTGLGGLFPM